jgi:hypothetical protein
MLPNLLQAPSTCPHLVTGKSQLQRGLQHNQHIAIATRSEPPPLPATPPMRMKWRLPCIHFRRAAANSTLHIHTTGTTTTPAPVLSCTPPSRNTQPGCALRVGQCRPERHWGLGLAGIPIAVAAAVCLVLKRSLPAPEKTKVTTAHGQGSGGSGGGLDNTTFELALYTLRRHLMSDDDKAPCQKCTLIA